MGSSQDTAAWLCNATPSRSTRYPSPHSPQQLLGSKLMADAVPSAWSKQWEGPEDSRKWLRAVVSKRVALTQWAAKVGTCICK